MNRQISENSVLNSLVPAVPKISSARVEEDSCGCAFRRGQFTDDRERAARRPANILLNRQETELLKTPRRQAVEDLYLSGWNGREHRRRFRHPVRFQKTSGKKEGESETYRQSA